jgi:hypothetical protein
VLLLSSGPVKNLLLLTCLSLTFGAARSRAEELPLEVGTQLCRQLEEIHQSTPATNSENAVCFPNDLATVPSYPASKIPLFQSNDMLEIEMVGNFPEFSTAHGGKLKYTYKGKHSVLDVTYEARGQYRRNRCSTFLPSKSSCRKAKPKAPCSNPPIAISSSSPNA